MIQPSIRTDDRVVCRDGCPIEVPAGAIGVVISSGADHGLFIRWPEVGVQSWTNDEAERWLVLLDDR